MSRTYRRKGGKGWWYGHIDLYWVLREFHYDRVYSDDGESYRFVRWYEHHSPKSKEGKKRVAKFHSDAATFAGGGKGHGPSWFINEYVQRPHRRDAAREIHKWMKDEDYEVIIESKPKREYWD
jgi:hypothetical protein